MTTEAGSGGLESRYRVEKINDPTGKHDECQYFVLDPRHDPLAREALRLYASRTPDPALRRDLRVWVESVERAIAAERCTCGCDYGMSTPPSDNPTPPGESS